MKALSIRQPWAWMILHAGKDVENRNWCTDYRGWVAIHAAKGCTHDEFEDAMLWIADRLAFPPAERAPGIAKPVDEVQRQAARSFAEQRLPPQAYSLTHDTIPRGCIVGAAVLHDCVSHQHTSLWFEGPYGFLLKDVIVLEKPIPMAGKLGLWECPELGDYPFATMAWGRPF